MELLDTIDTNLYISTFIDIDYDKANLYWNEIKNNKDLLEKAIKIKKVKAGDRYTLNALTIAYYMLADYKNIDSDVYYKLINHIYSNEDIAKKTLGNTSFFSPNRISFLNMSLINSKLKLTGEQKSFAIDEALSVYNNDASEYGIKYGILNNSSWNEREKKELLHLFWKDEESYEEILNNWEWDIVNRINSNSDNFLITEKENIYDLSKDKLFEIYNNDEEAVYSLLSSIDFCKMMHRIRPLESELEITKEKEVKEFNIHRKVKVKLTDYGKYILKQRKYHNNNIDENGYTEFELFELMHIFGSHMFYGNDELFEKNILIYTEDLKEKTFKNNSRKLVK